MCPAIDKDTNGGCYGHRQVVGHTIIANTLRSATRWQHVDSHCCIRYRQCTKGSTMKCTHDGEQQQRGCCQVAGKEYRESSKTNHQHHLARERVDEIATERTEQQCRDGVARQHQTDHILRGTKVFAEIQRQQGCQHIKGEKQREVGCHHLTVVQIPQSFVTHTPMMNSNDW